MYFLFKKYIKKPQVNYLTLYIQGHTPKSIAVNVMLLLLCPYKNFHAHTEFT